MTQPFAHLHLHTEYSIVDSTVRIPALMRRAAAAGMPALALTDQNNVFGLVKFYRQALAAGIKPLIGVDLLVTEGGEDRHADHLVLLCQDDHGYRNLTALVSRAYLEGQQRGVPMARRDWLHAEAVTGLVALSGGHAGDVGRLLAAGHDGAAAARLDEWLRVFGDRYYLELTRTGRPGEAAALAGALELAARQGVPVVATNDVRFLERADFEAHEARVCIHEGRTLDDGNRPRTYSREQYLRDGDEMAALFADLPEALDNALEIARRCNLDLELGRTVLPAFPVPEGQSTAGYLRSESERGLERFLERKLAGAGRPEEIAAPYRKRLADELDVICEMGFPGYFLIVADFIRWAKEQSIPVGPGRGSGAGSLVAFVLGITDLDPLEYDLLFERFLNPERVSMPDIDIDFDDRGRSTWPSAMAATASRRSSPTARWPRKPSCATPGGCSAIPTASSTASRNRFPSSSA